MSEAPEVSGLAGKPLGERMLGYWKMTGPGYMQSAMTLGGGSIASCAALGSMFGYKYLWVQIVAMMFGYFVLASVAKQTTSNGERSYKVFWRELHPSLAILWGGSALVATILWHIPQYSLTVNGIITLADGVSLDLDNKGTRMFAGLCTLGLAAGVVYLYHSGSKGLKVYERIVKTLVWGIVVAFGIVVVTGEPIDWSRLFSGLTGATFIRDFMENGLQEQAIVPVVGALAAAVGINMIFLYPYSLLEKGWGKEHKELAYFDLLSGMAFPFIIATCLMIVAVAKTIGPDAGIVGEGVRDIRQILPVVTPALGDGLGRLIIGGGIVGIGFSTIITHMLALGFIGCEMFGFSHEGRAKWWFSLVPAVGVFGAIIPFPVPLAITASTLAMPLMPITVICFIVLLNKKSYMGDEMPTGGMRVFWNTILSAAVVFMSGAAMFALEANWGKFQNLLNPPEDTAWILIEAITRLV
ncbi:MAG: divalent metal cation transporter [Candidatus Hydrogenedentota bacterium]